MRYIKIRVRMTSLLNLSLQTARIIKLLSSIRTLFWFMGHAHSTCILRCKVCELVICIQSTSPLHSEAETLFLSKFFSKVLDSLHNHLSKCSCFRLNNITYVDFRPHGKFCDGKFYCCFLYHTWMYLLCYHLNMRSVMKAQLLICKRKEGRPIT